MSISDQSTLICNPPTILQQSKLTALNPILVCINGEQSGDVFHLVDREKWIIGSEINSEINILDLGVSRAHAEITIQKNNYYIRDLNSSNGTFLNGERIVSAKINDGDQINVGSKTIFKFSLSNSIEANYISRTTQKLELDELTGIYNKRAFIVNLHKQIILAKNKSTPLILFMGDIDHFKQVNDTYGHVIGDQVLSNIAHLLKNAFRNSDYTCRYGGEEFAVICPYTTVNVAKEIGKRVLKKVESHVFTTAQNVFNVTISMGISPYSPKVHKNMSDFVNSADRALYKAKQLGRNCIVTA